MAIKIFTPSMLKGAGTRGVPEIPVGSSFTNTYSFEMSHDILDSDTIICEMSHDILEWNIHAHFRGILHCIAWGMPFLMLQLCVND